MQIKDAMAIVSKAYPKHDIDRVKETKKYFVMHIVPKGKSNDMLRMTLSCDDSLIAVDKRTGDTFTYNPIRDRD